MMGVFDQVPYCQLLQCHVHIITCSEWRSVLLVEETGVPGENSRPVVSH
jgi:hypothetical protein